MRRIRVNDLSISFPIVGRRARRRTAEASIDTTGSGQILEGGPGGRRVLALSSISFDLNDGDRLALVGRNGSGKSTLLRALAGVYPPTAGEIETVGRVQGLYQVGLGMKAEATGYRNIVLRGLMQGLSREEIDARVPAIAEFSGLGEYLKMPLHTYSQGMAMRLAFATATALTPDILLLDEWLGAGDREFSAKVQARLHRLVEDAGVVVLASHSRNLVSKICNVGLWLDRGVQRMFGPLDEVFAAVDAAAEAEREARLADHAQGDRRAGWTRAGDDVFEFLFDEEGLAFVHVPRTIRATPVEVEPNCVRVRLSGGVAQPSSGRALQQSFALRVPPVYEAAVAGRRARVTLIARAAKRGTEAPFSVAYSTNGKGNSGWVAFSASDALDGYSFEYDVHPARKRDPEGHVGIAPPGEGGLILDRIRIEVADGAPPPDA